ncbi:MAG: hypothetical protein ACOCUO_00470 [archaeon]
MSDASDLGDELVSGEGDDVSIDAAKVASIAGGSIVLAISGAYITIIEAGMQVNARAIRLLGGFFEEAARITLGDSAALVVASWETGATAAMEAGAVAPWILTIEALAIIAIVTTLWERRPYA